MEILAEFERKRPLLEHIDELFKRLRRCVVWIMLGAGVAYVYSGTLVRLLETPLLERLPPGGHLVFTAPFEKIWVYIRISLFAGLLVVSPFVGYEVACFLGPALKPNEKKRIVYFVGSFLAFFVAGVLLGYKYVLPVIINAAVHFGSGFEQPFLTVSSYISVALGILVFSALILEIPIVMSHLSGWGWVNAKTWAQGRKISVVINAVIAAMLAPPDALSMVIMMVPLQLLYESGIWGAHMAQWLSNKRQVENYDSGTR